MKLDAPEMAPVVEALEAGRKTGRPGFPIRAMVGLAIIKAERGLNWTDVLELVVDDVALHATLGCEGVPSQWACYRFERALRDTAERLELVPATRLALGLPLTAAQRREITERRERERIKQIAHFREMRRRGERLPWQIVRPEAASPCSELDKLIAEQRADAWRSIISQYGSVSFDAVLVVGGDDLHELFGGRVGLSAEEELLLAEDAATVERIAGRLAMTDAVAFDGSLVAGVRERLLAAEIRLPNVQRKERERLRDPERHRGSAPPLEFQRMSTSHKHRKPGHRSSAGGRYPSRKPRRRWNRERVVYDWKAAA